MLSAVSHLVSTQYIFTALLLNPLILLHCANTYARHFIPSAIPTLPSTSRFPELERLGWQANAEPWFDVHEKDGLLQWYAGVIVLVQFVAYDRVAHNREEERSVKEAKKERDLRKRRERSGHEKDVHWGKAARMADINGIGYQYLDSALYKSYGSGSAPYSNRTSEGGLAQVLEIVERDNEQRRARLPADGVRKGETSQGGGPAKLMLGEDGNPLLARRTTNQLLAYGLE
jgi:hypothetical protein